MPRRARAGKSVRDAAFAQPRLWADVAGAYRLRQPARAAARAGDRLCARRAFPPGRPILDGAADLMPRIRADFVYDPEATDVSTPLDEAFEKRHGVCQDFAHVMIAGLRGLGLPAAYVSGYLRTLPPPGKPRLEGADATHAWVSLWCGAELGWVGFDPTNALAGRRTTTSSSAVGRDYADVSPIDGIILGGASRS